MLSINIVSLSNCNSNISLDVGTQQMYQTMDPCFVGLIFSVFSGDKSTMVNKFCAMIHPVLYHCSVLQSFLNIGARSVTDMFSIC